MVLPLAKRGERHFTGWLAVRQFLPRICGAYTGLIAGKPAPTGFVGLPYFAYDPNLVGAGLPAMTE
ncbi:hypothetical protein A1D17_04750 [Pseudomonas fluorescens]|uniref:Uncharacterized protein n=1 Tax=Pseudomonas fluorescens TaxID=294 RepID=A0A166MDA1_PSEFL|nr:hypothetical protein A1D17_04750 [Pseudomonas fluorescens]